MIALFRSMPAAALALGLVTFAAPARAQISASDLIIRIERMENQIRELTGTIEQLQYRNQQLEQQVRQMQGAADPRMSEAGARGAAPAVPPIRSVGAGQPLPPPVAAAPPIATAPPIAAAPAAPMRRADVFDPSQNPSAPGVPRTLGRMETIAPAEEPPMNAPPVGAPGGRAPGAPLDLAALGGHTSDDAMPPGAVAPPSAGPLPPPPPRNPNGTGALATLPPSATPRDEYDLGYGYVLRKDYALADQTLRAFLKKYPTDRRVPDAYYWLGEAMFQRQLYREAAEVFLNLSRDHGTAAKAPDALLRLGESLGALGEKDAACGTLTEVGRKYPRASLAVKQGVEREKKRVHCS